MGSASFSNASVSWQTWTVPAGVTSVTVDARGSAGEPGVGSGLSAANGSGGNGARTQCVLSVTPGDVLYIAPAGGTFQDNMSGPNWSGGQGGQGYDTGVRGTATYYGGNGGAASWIRLNGTTGTPLVVAAGGGGGGVAGYPGVVEAGGNGGAGGTTTTASGAAGAVGGDNSTDASAGGGAGAAVAGTGGTTAGASGNGVGPAGVGGTSYGAGGQGRHDASMFWGLGGGGGGGYYGGGAGGASPAGYAGCGGGGGSCYTNPTYATSVQHTRGYNATTGGVDLTWTDPPSNTEPVVQSADLTDGDPLTTTSLIVTAQIYDPDVGQTKRALFQLQEWSGGAFVHAADYLGTTSTSTSAFSSQATITGLVSGTTYRVIVYGYDGTTYTSTPTYGAQFTVNTGTVITQTRGPDNLGLTDSRSQVATLIRSGGSRTEGAPVGDENGRVLTDENGDWLSDGDTYTRDDLRNTDSITVVLSKTATITDTIGITDTRSDVDTIVRSRTDGLGLLDGVTYQHVTSIIEVTVKRVLVGT